MQRIFDIPILYLIVVNDNLNRWKVLFFKFTMTSLDMDEFIFKAFQNFFHDIKTNISWISFQFLDKLLKVRHELHYKKMISKMILLCQA